MFGSGRWLGFTALVLGWSSSLGCGRTTNSASSTPCRGTNCLAETGGCLADDECESGFCDRTGTCEPVDRASRGPLGLPCQVAPRNPEGTVNGLLNVCGPYLCLQGRCRSCLRDEECTVETGAPSCGHFENNAQRPGNRCGNYSAQGGEVGPALPAPTSEDKGTASLERLTVEVVAVTPHATNAQTQGLSMVKGELFESIGGEATSQLRRLDRDRATPVQAFDLAASLYGEGLAYDGERLVQLTLEAGRALVWTLPDLTQESEMAFEGPGWGLCHDGDHFFMSDGTGTLQKRATEDFALLESVNVELPSGYDFASVRLNELECEGGDLWANVLEYREILRIAPEDGRVTAVIDTRNLLRHPDVPRDQLGSVGPLNGIAHDPQSGHLLLTGKGWPVLFEVRLVEDDLFR